MRVINSGRSNIDLFASLGLLIVMLLGVGGWIANIVKIVSTMADPISGVFIVRIVGIFAFPLGALLGFF